MFIDIRCVLAKISTVGLPYIASNWNIDQVIRFAMNLKNYCRINDAVNGLIFI